MSLSDRLRWAIAPDPRRSMSLLLGGVAVFAALGGMATFVEVPRVVAGAMVLVMALAWFVGFCGMIGYLRWAIRSAFSEERNTRSTDPKE